MSTICKVVFSRSEQRALITTIDIASVKAGVNQHIEQMLKKKLEKVVLLFFLWLSIIVYLNNSRALFTRSVKKFVRRTYFCFLKHTFKRRKFSA